jgi:SAM-dependent methyltransferase
MRPDLAKRFPWPSPARPDGVNGAVRWVGEGFEVAGTRQPILSFDVSSPRWTGDLTSLPQASSATHPVDVAARERAVGELRRHHMTRNATILDVGCSSGYLLDLARKTCGGSLIIGADHLAAPLRALAERTPKQPLLQFDVTRCPLQDACIDAVVALNVLEHIKDDARGAREIFRVLKPGGVAIIELPAGPLLYDVHDQVLMHERRYSMRGAKDLLTRAGFTIERASHVGFFLFPAFAALKLRNKRHMGSPAAVQRDLVARMNHETGRSVLVDRVMKLETWGSRLVRYPFGAQCVLTAVKRSA